MRCRQNFLSLRRQARLRPISTALNDIYKNECSAGRLESRLIAGRYLIERVAVHHYLEASKTCPNAPRPRHFNGVTNARYGRSSGMRERSTTPPFNGYGRPWRGCASSRLPHLRSRTCQQPRSICEVYRRLAKRFFVETRRHTLDRDDRRKRRQFVELLAG